MNWGRFNAPSRRFMVLCLCSFAFISFVSCQGSSIEKGEIGLYYTISGDYSGGCRESFNIPEGVLATEITEYSIKDGNKVLHPYGPQKVIFDEGGKVKKLNRWSDGGVEATEYYLNNDFSVYFVSKDVLFTEKNGTYELVFGNSTDSPMDVITKTGPNSFSIQRKYYKGAGFKEKIYITLNSNGKIILIEKFMSKDGGGWEIVPVYRRTYTYDGDSLVEYDEEVSGGKIISKRVYSYADGKIKKVNILEQDGSGISESYEDYVYKTDGSGMSQKTFSAEGKTISETIYVFLK